MSVNLFLLIWRLFLVNDDLKFFCNLGFIFFNKGFINNFFSFVFVRLKYKRYGWWFMFMFDRVMLGMLGFFFLLYMFLYELKLWYKWRGFFCCRVIIVIVIILV